MHRSYVAGDKIYCLHETDDADTVREHARRGGFPADHVVPVAAEFGTATADSSASDAQPPRDRTASFARIADT